MPQISPWDADLFPISSASLLPSWSGSSRRPRLGVSGPVSTYRAFLRSACTPLLCSAAVELLAKALTVPAKRSPLHQEFPLSTCQELQIEAFVEHSDL